MARSLGRLFFNSINKVWKVPERGMKFHLQKTLRARRTKTLEFYAKMSPEERINFGKRSDFLEWNYNAEIYAFGKRLHEEFHPELLVQAFTHRSYVVKEELKQKELGVENPQLNLEVNDNLASEGEKIIFDYSGRYVSHFFPRFPREGIDAVTNYLTSDELLAYVAKNLGTEFLILTAEYPVLPSTYSKTLKAIIGALKECQGLQRSQIFVRDFIVSQLSGKDINDFFTINNPMEVLSEILKKDGRSPPEPRIIFQAGMNTILANYHVGIYSNKELIGHCSGESVDTAIEMAAYDALKRLFHTTDSCAPITYDLKSLPEAINNLKLKEWNSAAFNDNLKK